MTDRPTLAELERRVAELEAELAEAKDWAPLEVAAALTHQPIERLRTLKRRGKIVAETRYGNRVYVKISSVIGQAKKRLHPR